jgi:hypothetical protein
VTRAAAALALGHPETGIALLESVKPDERGYPMANYIRGLAYLKLKNGQEAAAEFQKILDHRGANWGPLYPLPYVGAACGQALAGDTAAARKAYEKVYQSFSKTARASMRQAFLHAESDYRSRTLLQEGDFQ